MSPSLARVLGLIGTTALVVAGCGGREVPVRFAEQSALSPCARAAPVGDPTVSLAGDPPLPGEPVGPWTGLAADGGVPTAGGHVHAH